MMSFWLARIIVQPFEACVQIEQRKPNIWNRLESLSVFLRMLIYRAVGRLAIPHIFVGNHFSLPQ